MRKRIKTPRGTVAVNSNRQPSEYVTVYTFTVTRAYLKKSPVDGRIIVIVKVLTSVKRQRISMLRRLCSKERHEIV